MLPVNEIESIRAIVRETLAPRIVKNAEASVPSFPGELVIDEKKAVWIALDSKAWRKLSN